MGNILFDFAKGRWVEKYLLPVGGDNIIVVLLQSSGLQSDSSLGDYSDLHTLLASNAEATFTNYGRIVLSGVSITVSVNTGTGITTVDIPDEVWNSAGGATNNTLGALLTCYRKISTDADTAILPVSKHDFTASTTGGNLTAAVPSIGTQP